jgi:hypothetical protein
MEQAQGGSLQETKIARALGLTLQSFRRIIKNNEDAQAVWEEGLAAERDAILAKMSQLALEGDQKAAQFLLAARHGLRERGGDDGDSGARVVISLPNSMSEAQYRRVMQVEQQSPQIGHG